MWLNAAGRKEGKTMAEINVVKETKPGTTDLGRWFEAPLFRGNL
jgi:hypothetical protein